MMQATANYWFNRLDVLLHGRPLLVDQELHPGPKTRFASADEFMLMNETDKHVAFKHRDTRNYVFIDKRNGTLEVPVTDKAFMHGQF